MSKSDPLRRDSIRLRRAGARKAALVLLVAGALGGCETNSFLDPSVIGRWEKTPTVMPILDRLSVIEDEPAEFVQTSAILESDLIPELSEYRLGGGDVLEIRIRDFFALGVEEPFQRSVDQRGFIELPRLGAIRVLGRTSAEAVTAVEGAIRERQISNNPVVSISLLQQRKQTFSVLGAVQTPGTFFIPAADYRLLEGLTTAGGVNETIPEIFVIRQILLTDEAAGRLPEPEPTRRNRPGRAAEPRPSVPAGDQPKGDDLIDLIDELSKPKTPQGAAPGIIGAQPDGQPARIARAADGPAIDLPDAMRPASAPGGAALLANPDGAGSGWVFADGKWMKVNPGTPGVDGGPAATGEQRVVTQRVIRIPVGPLLAGAADVNIVIRPGDVLRVPQPRSGLVYMTGFVGRPGPYNLPTEGKLTLQRAIVAAGGLSGLAIPERVDLTRVVGKDRQATIRLDLRAIAEQTQPDIYLKPDDQINVGTNFWATPLAVIRGGFRASYGFGFILDRNFDEDVFGVRPSNQRF